MRRAAVAFRRYADDIAARDTLLRRAAVTPCRGDDAAAVTPPCLRLSMPRRCHADAGATRAAYAAARYCRLMPLAIPC